MFGLIDKFKGLFVSRFAKQLVGGALMALVGALAAMSHVPGITELAEAIQTNLGALTELFTGVLAGVVVYLSSRGK